MIDQMDLLRSIRRRCLNTPKNLAHTNEPHLTKAIRKRTNRCLRCFRESYLPAAYLDHETFAAAIPRVADCFASQYAVSLIDRANANFLESFPSKISFFEISTRNMGLIDYSISNQCAY